MSAVRDTPWPERSSATLTCTYTGALLALAPGGSAAGERVAEPE
jgi:hypothetical protein